MDRPQAPLHYYRVIVEEAKAQRGQDTRPGSHSCYKETCATSVKFPFHPSPATLSLHQKDIWGKQTANILISSRKE